MRTNKTFVVLALIGALGASPFAVRASELRGTGAAGCQTLPRTSASEVIVPNRHLAIAANGDAVVTGCVRNGFDEDIATIRIRRDTGALAWASYFAGNALGDGRGDDGATHAVVDAADNVIVAGYAWALDGTGGRSPREYVIKYDGATGAQLWAQSAGARSAAGFRSLAVDSAGRVFTLGVNFPNDFDVVVHKRDGATGAVLWSASFGRSTEGALEWLEARTLLLDAAGDAYVMGIARGPSGKSVTVLRLDGATGALVWRSRSPMANDYSSDMALDPAGFIVTAGRDVSGQGVLARFSAANGMLLWERGIDFGFYGAATALRLDPAGDPIVVGSGGTADKLSRADGTTTWRKEFGIPLADSTPTGFALSVDASGDAFVTGSAWQGSAVQIRTARLRGADGAYVWDAVRPTNGREYATALQPDGNGGLMVSGVSGSGSSSMTFLVLRHDASTGAPRWTASNPALDPGWPPSYGDPDGDGVPTVIEEEIGLSPAARDNDVSGNPELFVRQFVRDFRDGEGIDFPDLRSDVNALQTGLTTRARVIENHLVIQDTVVASVSRLYLTYFLRVPDYGGLRYHAERLRAGVSLAAVADNFAASPEFIDRYGMLTDPQFVDLVYQNVLDRAPEPAGRQYYLDRLGDGRLTRGSMMVGFSESPEFRIKSESRRFLIALYAGMLRRDPEPAAQDYYLNLLRNSGMAGYRSLIEGVLASPEYRARFLP